MRFYVRTAKSKVFVHAFVWGLVKDALIYLD